MRKHFLILVFVTCLSFVAQAQTVRGARIGYIDMEYILQNVPDYTEANNQLEEKVQKWKQEIELKKNEITNLKEALKTERVLLTKELIEEREDEIKFIENDLLDYQQKRFGPSGDLIIQREALVKPIQDQIFTAIQDIAVAKRYDFIFDKSSDLTMLFAGKNFDISESVIRTITRSTKREQLTKKQLKAEEIKEYKENLEDVNPEIAERRKILEDKKKARDQLYADKKAAYEAKKNETLTKRQQMIDEREAKKNGTPLPIKEEVKTEEQKVVANEKEVARKALEEAQAKAIEDRKKVLAERKAKILADREAVRKAKLEKLKEPKKE